ncbi:esterase family protein [Ottowia sp. GY511]|uniref:Alpha/beta hydrolase n=1 Tax=Ottowia flava TaxID=2675430 RepID=A0ABW4L262_9BURK|nr:esterase family protein [Ottowia sp. GY511]TXK22534.1 esterase family protein [Ottowia sp. GY511]
MRPTNAAPLPPAPGLATRRAWLATGALVLLPLAGCVPPIRPVQDRMDRVLDLAQPGARARTLLVLLPGAYDTPQDFIREGFVVAVRERQLPVDLLLLDAHTGYYTSQQIVDRLLNEVVRPAREQGYARIWLVGISLGGYGSLLFTREHADLIDGAFVMAAFLGRRDLPAAIGQAGGLRTWDGQLDGADAHDLALWRWLRERALSPGPQRPPLWIGYGDDDRFVASNRLIAATLPPAQVLVTDGGHAWAPWRRLWDRFLDLRAW